MYPSLKRLMDIVLAALGLVLSAPLMAVIAAAIRLDSPGPVIFSQARLGLRGQVFRIHKFRKFPADWGDKGAGVTVAGDARMTRLGHFLERTKLDELPQLWNIIKGEMSFVGPRPESLRFSALFTNEFTRVHDYLPGVFGPNQVAFRNESQLYPPDQDPEVFYRQVLFPQKARNDIAYFQQATLLSDFLWILRGLWFSVVGTIDWGKLARQRGPSILLDLVLVEVAWLLANLARFDGLPPGRYWGAYVTGTWLMPLVVLPVIALGRNYRGVTRHFSAGDAVRLGSSSLLAWTLAYLALLGYFQRDASLGIALMGFLLSTGLMAGARLLYREHRRRVENAPGEHESIRLVVYGAGTRGVALAALLDHGFPRVQVVGFLDDNDEATRGKLIAGRPVLGSERDLLTIHAVHPFDQLWTSFDPNRIKYSRLKTWCSKHHVRLLVLPAIPPFLDLCFPPGVDADDDLDERVTEDHSIAIDWP